MRTITTSLITLNIGFIIGMFLATPIPYYDGEGNAIPDKAVKILVMSQFVHIDSTEQVILNKYFYNH